MAKKPNSTPPAETPEAPQAPEAYEPTEQEIKDLIRQSLGGIPKDLARLILIDRHRNQQAAR